MSGDYKFDTLSLHAGHVPDERHGSRAVPIHQTTSYVFKDTEHAAALYNMELGGNVYTRISNPTVAVLEQRPAHRPLVEIGLLHPDFSKPILEPFDPRIEKVFVRIVAGRSRV